VVELLPLESESPDSARIGTPRPFTVRDGVGWVPGRGSYRSASAKTCHAHPIYPLIVRDWTQVHWSAHRRTMRRGCLMPDTMAEGTARDNPRRRAAFSTLWLDRRRR